jgi:hypothetical protein
LSLVRMYVHTPYLPRSQAGPQRSRSFLTEPGPNTSSTGLVTLPVFSFSQLYPTSPLDNCFLCSFGSGRTRARLTKIMWLCPAARLYHSAGVRGWLAELPMQHLITSIICWKAFWTTGDGTPCLITSRRPERELRKRPALCFCFS